MTPTATCRDHLLLLLTLPFCPVQNIHRRHAGVLFKSHLGIGRIPHTGLATSPKARILKRLHTQTCWTPSLAPRRPQEVRARFHSRGARHAVGRSHFVASRQLSKGRAKTAPVAKNTHTNICASVVAWERKSLFGKPYTVHRGLGRLALSVLSVVPNQGAVRLPAVDREQALSRIL